MTDDPEQQDPESESKSESEIGRSIKPSSNQYPNNHQLGTYENQRVVTTTIVVALIHTEEDRGKCREKPSVYLHDHRSSEVKRSQRLVRASSSNDQRTTLGYGNVNSGGGYGAHEDERGCSRNGDNKEQDQSGSLCRAISTRMDPETLKIMGNEDYKNGNFAEALALYDAAIAIDPNKAAYRSNKSAALTALGRILDAVLNAEKLSESSLITIGHIIGWVRRSGESMYHSSIRAKAVQTHLNKCTEAKRLRDWNGLITETQHNLSAGADAAPQVYSLQAEAWLKTHRHQEADDALSKCPVFDVETSTRYYGPVGYAGFLVVRAQVHLASGRRSNAPASWNGITVRWPWFHGELKRWTFEEACAAYGEGLDHDPRNSVLLCNRAACRSKLGRSRNLLTTARQQSLSGPGYRKARLRRV
ncbi:hypothetical protein HID58_095248 [Brassica napus]|uniref:Uncharacterized protein n=1 Tax=Brassica napus TaxID=3708 RepID=A0ABQ7X4E1_BRANA|nr:hypothetical protein HID58_095248 [Brassica napus]